VSSLPFSSTLFWPASRGLTAAGPVDCSVSLDNWLLTGVLGVVGGEVEVVGDEVGFIEGEVKFSGDEVEQVKDEAEAGDEVELSREGVEVKVEVVGTESQMMEADVRGVGTGLRVLEGEGAGADEGSSVDKWDSGSLGVDGGNVETFGSVVEAGEEVFGGDGGVVGT
jgi:hypothetical protein